jgi:hypothetical protein
VKIEPAFCLEKSIVPLKMCYPLKVKFQESNGKVWSSGGPWRTGYLKKSLNLGLKHGTNPYSFPDLITRSISRIRKTQKTWPLREGQCGVVLLASKALATGCAIGLMQTRIGTYHVIN